MFLYGYIAKELCDDNDELLSEVPSKSYSEGRFFSQQHHLRKPHNKENKKFHGSGIYPLE